SAATSSLTGIDRLAMSFLEASRCRDLALSRSYHCSARPSDGLTSHSGDHFTARLAARARLTSHCHPTISPLGSPPERGSPRTATHSHCVMDLPRRAGALAGTVSARAVRLGRDQALTRVSGFCFLALRDRLLRRVPL